MRLSFTLDHPNATIVPVGLWKFQPHFIFLFFLLEPAHSSPSAAGLCEAGVVRNLLRLRDRDCPCLGYRPVELSDRADIPRHQCLHLPMESTSLVEVCSQAEGACSLTCRVDS
ncbi:hypothetical protein F5148DRAFT_561670 [Russula earlei]|uniref:Uncharacterized protein n=1 Tax=Russula earlei TaxID=71964 RepID=A0ACC0UN46_9AGAM|nr:hypothetical protein F5148DRAFT_561670 [Russula earlei]